MKSYSNEKTDRLLRTLQEAQGNSLDIYYVLCREFLFKDENPSVLLQLILEYPEKIGTDDGASGSVPEQVEIDTAHQYRELLKNTVALLIKPNDPSDLFYEKLWDAVFRSPTAPAETDQCAVVLKLLIEDIPQLPYYQAHELVSMEDDEYSVRINTLKSRIREAVHMFNRHFSQKTEEVSQICRLGRNLSPEDECVYWAAMLGLIQKSAFQAGYRSGLAKNIDVTSDNNKMDKPISE